MKRKLLLMLPILLLASCGESSDPKQKENDIEKNDEVIIGLMSGQTQPTYHYVESPSDFYNDVICNVYPDYFAYFSIDGSFTVATQSGFDNFDYDNYGSISKEGESGSLLIEVDLSYPVFGSNLEDKYAFNFLVWNIQNKEIRCESPSFYIGDLEKGMKSSIYYTKDIVYADIDSEGNIEKYYKYSRLTINYIPVHDKVESYVIKEYNKNDELIKTSQGDFEDITYYTDLTCQYVIIEKTCKHYSYDWDESKLVSSDVVIKEVYNRATCYDNDECVSFYEDQSGEIQKQILGINFDESDS